jgi:hypothetical protein
MFASALSSAARGDAKYLLIALHPTANTNRQLDRIRRELDRFAEAIGTAGMLVRFYRHSEAECVEEFAALPWHEITKKRIAEEQAPFLLIADRDDLEDFEPMKPTEGSWALIWMGSLYPARKGPKHVLAILSKELKEGRNPFSALDKLAKNTGGYFSAGGYTSPKIQAEAIANRKPGTRGVAETIDANWEAVRVIHAKYDLSKHGDLTKFARELIKVLNLGVTPENSVRRCLRRSGILARLEAGE